MTRLFGKYSSNPVLISFLALSFGLTVGVGALKSAAAASEKKVIQSVEKEIPVQVQKEHSNRSMRRFDLDAAINKMRDSAPKLSLPSSMFEPWWQTMFHDPDSEWLLRNFDIMSSDPGKKWAFPLGSGAYIPRVDINKSGQSLEVSAEVPGIDEKNLSVEVTDESISIKGEKVASEMQKTGKDFQSIERHYGSFERTITLPCKVDSDRAEARLKNGVLTVLVPMTQKEASSARKLTIMRE